MQLKVDLDGAEPGQFTFTLAYDATKIILYDRLWSAPGDPPSGNVIPPGEITDSDNDGTVETTDRTEDDKEDAIGGVGKRIFINKDDDNTNGKADAQDTKTAYTDPEPDINDNDFAEIRLAFTGAGSAALDGYSLWLGADAGLTVWGDKRKTPLSDLPDAPDRTSNLWHI